MAKLAEVKTKPSSDSVAQFIDSIPDEQKRSDCRTLLQLMEKATKEKPMMWGTAIVGFGYAVLTSKSGRTVEWMKIGFSPRKANLSLYLNCDLKQFGERLYQLGKHKTGMGCLYINKLSDVDMKVLQKLITAAAKQIYPGQQVHKS